MEFTYEKLATLARAASASKDDATCQLAVGTCVMSGRNFRY